MKDYLEFVNSQNAWFPVYVIVILLLAFECVDCWFKLRRARKRIKILELEKDLLFEEQAELKQIIKTKVINLN